MVCPYCGSGVELTDRSILKKDSSTGSDKIYVCERYPSCDSYVGCKPQTDEPLGTLANGQLRMLRMEAHKAFDWAWESGHMSRTKAYEAMQRVMALSKEAAHIGKMDVEQCRRVIEIFGEYKALRTPYKVPKPI